MIHWIVKVHLTRIHLHLLRIRMLSISQKPLTKVTFLFFAFYFCLSSYPFFFFPKDQLLKARTSIVKRVRSVGKSSRNTPSKHHHPLPRSQSQSPHPPPLATLPPVSPSPSSALGSGSKSPNPVSPFDFSSPSSATTPRRNHHYPSSSASDSDAFNQSSEATYKGKITFFTSFFCFVFYPSNHYPFSYSKINC